MVLFPFPLQPFSLNSFLTFVILNSCKFPDESGQAVQFVVAIGFIFTICFSLRPQEPEPITPSFFSPLVRGRRDASHRKFCTIQGFFALTFIIIRENSPDGSGRLCNSCTQFVSMKICVYPPAVQSTTTSRTPAWTVRSVGARYPYPFGPVSFCRQYRT